MDRRDILLTAIASCFGTYYLKGEDPPMTGIIHDNASAHPLIDIAFWEGKSKDSQTVELRSEILSPSDVLTINALRANITSDLPQLKRISVDLFFWVRLKPKRPWLTKFGGTPFRNRNAPWPTFRDQPMTFVAQLCYRDSQDLFQKKLPGDLLQIYLAEKTPNEAAPFSKECNIVAEWVTIDEVLAPLETHPQTRLSLQIPILSGVRYRTFDLNGRMYKYELLNSSLKKYGSRWSSLLSLPCTKIGASYFPVQQGFDPLQWVIEQLGIAADPIGVLYSVGSGDRPYYLDAPNGSPDRNLDFYMGDPGHLLILDANKKAAPYYIHG